MLAGLFLTICWISPANADSLWFQFKCISSSDGATYSMQMNSMLSTTTIFVNTYNLSCDEVCVDIQDRDGDANDETDGLTNEYIKRYQGDLDLDVIFWSELDDFGDADSGDHDTTYDITEFCWDASWDNGDQITSYSSASEIVTKTVFYFTDEDSNTKNFTVVSGFTSSYMWP